MHRPGMQSMRSSRMSARSWRGARRRWPHLQGAHTVLREHLRPTIAYAAAWHMLAWAEFLGFPSSTSSLSEGCSLLKKQVPLRQPIGKLPSIL